MGILEMILKRGNLFTGNEKGNSLVIGFLYFRHCLAYNFWIMAEKIFIISCIVMAIWATMWEKGIFGFVRRWLKNIPEKLQFPIFDCPVCMTMWYGSVVYWLVWGISIKEYIIVIIAATGLNAIFVKLFHPDE